MTTIRKKSTVYVSSLDDHFTVFFTSKYHADPGETFQLLKFLKPHKHEGLSFLSWFSWQTPCQNPCHKKELDMVVQAYNTCNTNANINRRIFFWLSDQPFYPNWLDVGHLMTLSQKEVSIISKDDKQSCFLIATQENSCAHTHLHRGKQKHSFLKGSCIA